MAKIRFEEPSATSYQTRVHFEVHVPDRDEPVLGSVLLTDSLRTCVDVVLDGECLDSYKLDPNEAGNDYAVVAAEMMALRPLTLPVLTNDPQLAAAVAAQYATSARCPWK